MLLTTAYRLGPHASTVWSWSSQILSFAVFIIFHAPTTSPIPNPNPNQAQSQDQYPIQVPSPVPNPKPIPNPYPNPFPDYFSIPAVSPSFGRSSLRRQESGLKKNLTSAGMEK
jgi:hypothetical protein